MLGTLSSLIKFKHIIALNLIIKKVKGSEPVKLPLTPLYILNEKYSISDLIDLNQSLL